MNNAKELFESSAFTKFQDMLPECGHDELQEYIDKLFDDGLDAVAYACLKDWRDFDRECDEYAETLDAGRDSFRNI